MGGAYSFDGVLPVVDSSAFVHPDAVIIGDVIIAAGCYVGPAAVLRGDFGRIEIGAGANVQETCVIHSFPNRDVVVEELGHVGHGAVLHGCHLERNVLVGMNSVIMDEARIGQNCIVGALSFIKAKAIFEPDQMIAGAPARVLRPPDRRRDRMEDARHEGVSGPRPQGGNRDCVRHAADDTGGKPPPCAGAGFRSAVN